MLLAVGAICSGVLFAELGVLLEVGVLFAVGCCFAEKVTAGRSNPKFCCFHFVFEVTEGNCTWPSFDKKIHASGV